MDKIKTYTNWKKWTKLEKLQNGQNVKPGKNEGRINAKTKILLQVD